MRAPRVQPQWQMLCWLLFAAARCQQLTHSTGGWAPAPTGLLCSPKGTQWGNGVDKEFIFLFSRTALAQPVSLGWLADQLCQKPRAWCISLATMGNRIWVIFLWPLEEKGHQPQAEKLCELGWNQHNLSKSCAENSQGLESWCQIVMVHCWLVLFWQCCCRLQWSPEDARLSSQPCCHQHQWALGRAMIPHTTDWWWLKPAAVWLWENQIIKLPVTGLT